MAPIAHVREALSPAYSESLGINSPFVAAIAPKIIASAPLAYVRPAPLAAPVGHALHSPLVAVAPLTPSPALIRSYATSIYGPALISNKHQPLFQQTAVAAAQAPVLLPETGYQPPLTVPSVHYHGAHAGGVSVGAPIASQVSAEQGYYEPSLTYAHPAAWGYTFGLPSSWGYQLVYRRKK